MYISTTNQIYKQDLTYALYRNLSHSLSLQTSGPDDS